jgi:hypothetical protein
MIYLWKVNTEDVDEAKIHHVVKDIIRKDNTLLTHVFTTRYKDFATKYNTVYPLSVGILNPAGIDVNANSENDIDDIPINDLHGTLDQYFPRVNIATAAASTNSQELLNTQETTTVTTVALTETTTQDMDEDDYEILPTHHELPDAEISRLVRILKEVFVTNWSTKQRKLEQKLV